MKSDINHKLYLQEQLQVLATANTAANTTTSFRKNAYMRLQVQLEGLQV